MNPRSTLCSGLLLAIVLAACHDRNEETAPTAPPIRPATVVMLEPGQEPLAQRRYAIQPGLALGGTLMVVELRISQGGEKQPAPIDPALKLPIEAARTSAEADATAIEINFEAVPEPGDETGRTDWVQASAARLVVQDPLRFRVDAQGVEPTPRPTTSARTTDAAQIAVAGILEGLLRPVPYPEAPIGLGALWEVHREVEVGGVRLTELARYRITQLADTQMRLSLYLRQTAAPQTIQSESGETVEVISHQVEIDGAAIVDLELPLPIDVDAGLGSTTASVSGASGDGQQIVERQTAEIRLFVHTPEPEPNDEVATAEDL